MIQLEGGDYEWVVPLIVSNFITILLVFFFTKDRSQQEISFQHQIAKLEEHSLRAKMNPHFIFNALNGVQSVMMLKGEQMANRYLGVFSKLLRFTIEMTNNEMISMEDELGYLTTYVELQNMRLNNVLNFEIDIAESIDINKCFLPTMLLQPLVENAILHGLSTIKTNPTITLRVEKDDDFLVLKVEDNGVTYSYKTSFETFLSLTRSYSNIFEVTPGLLINLDKLEKIVHDSKHDEFICSLITERQIELSKSQRNRLLAHIQYYS